MASFPDADMSLSSHTIPDDPDRRNVSLDRCSPAMLAASYSSLSLSIACEFRPFFYLPVRAAGRGYI
jgi:hypothetical protein